MGYRQAIRSAGLSIDPNLIRVGSYELRPREGAARELAHDATHRPTAIFAANDLMALETLVVAGELGLRVPQDLSHRRVRQHPRDGDVEPALTTINQPIQQMGARSIEMLLQLMDGGKSHTDRHVTLPTELVVRLSTAVPPH